MILIIDNYDSFTFNLVQLIAQKTPSFRVVRNDMLSLGELRDLKPSGILISPGPGRPENAGVCVELITALGPTTPILGVCLGHQAIGHAFGAAIVHAPRLMHGKTSLIEHDGLSIFSGLPLPFEATRYHSLVIDPQSLPRSLSVTATTGDGSIMGVRHNHYPIEGIQFHPESVLTVSGPQIITNWLHSIVPEGA
jgi:anthranilate synthase component 2